MGKLVQRWEYVWPDPDGSLGGFEVARLLAGVSVMEMQVKELGCGVHYYEGV